MYPGFTYKTTGQLIILRILRKDRILITLPIKPQEIKISNFREMFITEGQ